MQVWFLADTELLMWPLISVPHGFFWGVSKCKWKGKDFICWRRAPLFSIYKEVIHGIWQTLFSIVKTLKFWSLCTSGNACTGMGLIPLTCLPPQALNKVCFLQWIFPYVITFPLCSSKHRAKKGMLKIRVSLGISLVFNILVDILDINNYNNTQNKPTRKESKLLF